MNEKKSKDLAKGFTLEELRYVMLELNYIDEISDDGDKIMLQSPKINTIIEKSVFLKKLFESENYTDGDKYSLMRKYRRYWIDRHEKVKDSIKNEIVERFLKAI